MTAKTPPIEVNRTPTKDQLGSAFRSLLMGLGTWAVGRGYLEADTATGIVTILLVAVPFLYGQWKIRTRGLQLAHVAASPKVPAAVARFKS